MVHSRAPLHLGGPLGAIGLGCVGGAVALAIAAINNTPSQPSGAAPGTAPMSVEIERRPLSERQPVEAGEDFAGQGLEPREPVAEIAQAGGGLPERAAEQPARAEGTEVHFIVRLKGAPEIDTITRNFKRDPDAAQKS